MSNDEQHIISCLKLAGLWHYYKEIRVVDLGGMREVEFIRNDQELKKHQSILDRELAAIANSIGITVFREIC